MTNPLEAYLTELRAMRSSGGVVKETSGYGALANLFNEIGHTLKPKVHCFIHVKNSGAGLPDGGLFTPDQLKNTDEDAPLHGIPLPSRGVIEVKGTDVEVDAIADTKQVRDYVKHYGQVLVTNYRSFLLLKRGDNGDPIRLESFQLAPDETSFWVAASQPRKATQELGERFAEYLKRVLLHASPLNNPKDVAFFLASYARDARARVESAGHLPALAAVRTALEEALGMKFEAEKGEHFFRSTLVQTVFYGVFSAWVLWHKEKPQRKDAFDWKSAAWTLHVPMIKALFEQVATPEIVQYQVARVDTALREELDIPDGLADPRVFVLDPCCGTGAYLVEVLRIIEKTLNEKSEDALVQLAVKEAAQKRVFGFEIMPAPFVVAHLQMGLLLQNLAVPLDDSKNERAGIFLTNALTGWDFAGENPKLANWPELEAERAGAGKVKQEKPILVILGNPPYNAYAGISPDEERGLVEPYKEGLINEWGIKKFNLDDLYVRFFRIAERKIAEHTLRNESRRGIVSFISNHSWIGDASFVVMRQHLLKSFDRIWVENLHGNRKISEYAPDGRTSETVFALQGFSVGIRQGVATSLLVRTGKKRKSLVLFRDDLNAARAADRREQMLASLKAKKFDAQYEKVDPSQDNRFTFRSSDVAAHYLAWPRLTELCAEAPSNGLMEKRGGALIEFDVAALEKRMRSYYDPNKSWEELAALKTGLTENAAGFDAKKVRLKVQAEEDFQPTHLRPYALRPFDTRRCYYSDVSPLWNRSRPTLWQQCWNGNSFLMSRPAGVASPEGFPLCYTTLLGDNDFLRGHAYYFPMRLRMSPAAKLKKKDGNGEFASILHEAAPAYKAGENKIAANLSRAARAYLTKLDVKNPDADADTAGLIWMHALAISYSPAYLAENADGVRQDWPRIPLPDSKAALVASAELGGQVAALLDTVTPVDGVDTGKIRPELLKLAVVTRLTKEPLNLSLTAGWGYGGKGGVTMPGKGKIQTRAFAQEESLSALGQFTYDIYLTNSACWSNVPEKVWDYTIGGYQVIKKWLSYREHELLGRPLTVEEAREVTRMVNRIAALILLQPELDANYLRVKAKTFAWKA
jgi:hypothetical protein